MEFIHRTYFPGQTIAALATPPGEGGIAIVRICGDEALNVAQKIFSGPVHSYKTHTAHLGKVLDIQGNFIDQALMLVMLGRRSYCGEDTVEIHCHGGGLIARKVLESALLAGARSAYPGEFTFKAFMNGKIDLAQAEAVQELISSKNEYAMRSAASQLEGSLSLKIQSFQKELFDIAAILEAWVDFPEEGLEFTTMEELANTLLTSMQKMQQLVDTFHDGKILHDGLAICLVGCPNVGKSSLMNLLLDKDRAIVTPIAGTTRDVLEDHLKINGLNVRLIDTAGIRETGEIIEKEGIRRSKNAMKEADLVLFVLDASKGVTDEDKKLFDEIPKEKTLVIWNKCDLTDEEMPSVDISYSVKMSAKQKMGLQDLYTQIDKIIWDKGPPQKDEVVISNVRHKESLQRAIESCKNVYLGLKDNVSPEFITLDMRACLTELGTIIGKDISESILTSIFSKFCIGK
jgi:tRNA modification GTPase